MAKKIKNKKTMFRAAELLMETLSKEERTIQMSFSSEEPYERYSPHWGGNYLEVLGHNAGEMNMDFITSGRAPFLLDHDVTEQVGVVTSVSVSDGRATASVLVSQSDDGTETLDDMVDGIKTCVSVGYTIQEEKDTGLTKDGKKIIRVVKWTPLEVSVVAIPADMSVGVGRSDSQEEDEDEEIIVEEIVSPRSQELEVTKMTIENTNVDLEQVKAEARKAEQIRVREISQLGAKFGLSREADAAVRGDTDIEAFRAMVLEKMDVTSKATAVKTDTVDMSAKEVRDYSFMNVIKAQLDPSYAKKAGLEIEVSRALADEMGVEVKGIMVPHNMMVRNPIGATATYGSSNGANFVATDLGSFIDILRNKMVMAQAGATILSGLRGNLALPKGNVAASAYWVNEVTAPTASDPKMTQVTFTPKTVGTYVDATRQLVLQSSYDVEQYLRNELIKVLSIELDRVGLYGNTSLSQPKGIVFATGLNTVDIPANAPTYANVWAMVASVESDNALEGSLKFVSSPTIRAAMATTQCAANTGRFIYENGQVAGYGVISSNQVTSTDLFFGDFSSAIYALWGGLDVVVDTAALATSGGIRVIALQAADFNVKYGESFCYAQ
jgi:HK97 family phage major capsid protein